MWHWLRRHLLRNLGIKLIALVLALTLYLHVFFSQEREMIFDVPITLHGVPESLIGSGDLPHTARVRFRGLGLALSKLRTDPQGARLLVEVGDIHEGLLQRPLVSGDVLLPSDIDVRVIEVIEPKELDIEFDRLRVKRLAVVPNVSGRPAPGFVMAGRVVAVPESVTVRGPQQLVDSFEFIRTEPLDVAGLDGVAQRRVALRVPGRCEAAPPEVTVRVAIDKVVSRTFAQLPVMVHRSGDVALRRLAPQTGSVVVSGPATLVDSLRTADLRLSIDAMGLPPGTYTLMASVELERALEAGAISIEPVQPEKFVVELE
jgi:YbbR domain-containing protein